MSTPGMAGKIATDGTREITIVIETISGDGIYGKTAVANIAKNRKNSAAHIPCPLPLLAPFGHSSHLSNSGFPTSNHCNHLGESISYS